ncbi:MAG TPA: outer membrane beta-barrel protein, partial [Candidatus Krumholzibacterium sp.]|nr:outer membrane beta-barrel protein [Candidatus Krumholzibacterium sp.]
HGDPGGYYQNLLVSRNLVIPPAGRYFNPAPYEGGPVSASAGDPGLEPGISDEVSFRIGFAGKVSLEAFARRESSIVHVSDEDPALLVQDGTSDVTGTRGRFRWDSRMFGMDYGCILTAEYYADRNDHTFGIAEYSILGSAYISRRSFKETETVMLRFDGVSSGERSWGDLTLDPFWTADLTFSITVMSAVIQLQYKNVFDSEYEVYPGYLQHGRHLRYGVIWNIID